MKLSIVIVSWNVSEDIVNCLRSIEGNRPRDDYEVIVVDNASTDGTADILKRDFSDSRLTVNKENRGFSAANNQAIKVAKGQYVLLLNPDTVVHAKALDSLISFLDANEEVGACGPSFLYKDGTYIMPAGNPPTFRSLLHGKTVLRSTGIFRGHYNKLKMRDFDFQKQAEVKLLSGAAAMIRRSVLEEVDMMDESFFLYYEDTDLFLRISKAGWRMVYVPEAVITHIGGRSSAQLSGNKQVLLYKSLFIYLRKHRGKWQTWLFALIFKPGVVIREIVHTFSGAAVFLISILLNSPKRRAKALMKMKKSLVFLWRHSLEFLCKC